MARVLSEKEEIDGVLLSSGLDDSFDVLEELDGLVGIIGNSPETIRRVRDKGSFFEELNRLGISHPHTTLVENFEEAKMAAKDTRYPVILKPTEGFGGFGVRKARDRSQLEKIFHEIKPTTDRILVQEFIEGVNASVSFVASSTRARTLSVNEQLLGLSEVHQKEPFGYCGNIVPLDIPDSNLIRCDTIVKKVSTSFKLRGSNGIDIVISEEGIPHVIEINPRFQGSLECVERVLGMNLVEIHVEASTTGNIPPNLCHPSGFSARLITYAPRRLSAPDLVSEMWARDVPFPGSIVEKGEPLCSIVLDGRSKSDAWKKALMKAQHVYDLSE